MLKTLCVKTFEFRIFINYKALDRRDLWNEINKNYFQ